MVKGSRKDVFLGGSPFHMVKWGTTPKIPIFGSNCCLLNRQKKVDMKNVNKIIPWESVGDMVQRCQIFQNTFVIFISSINNINTRKMP